MGSLLITNAHIMDPAAGLDLTDGAILIEDGIITFCGSRSELPENTISDHYDAGNNIVTPGLIDIHVHLREPGMEEEETVATGSAAAVAGGFSTICCMPNTTPALDSEALMHFIRRESKKIDMAEIFPVGAITAGRRGEEISEMDSMVRGGAVAFSDDGCAVASTNVLKQAMTYAKMLDRTIMEHCEDPTLTAGGIMNEGYVSTSLGLQGIPSEAEEIIVARDILLAKLTGARLHLQHISTSGAIKILKLAKAEGVRVTAEVCPHHLTLTEEELRSFNPVFKVAPPLRSSADVAACIEALNDGTIDCIASDHAPHLAEEKEVELANAPCGLIGIETTLGVLLTDLVKPGKLPLKRMIAALTAAPAKIVDIDRGTLTKGAIGNVTVIDINKEWVVDASSFKSKSANCPWNGRRLTGKAICTVVKGKIVYKDNTSTAGNEL